MTIFCEGIASLRPSAFLPDLMAMQSSPVLKKQFSTSTSVQDSGSHPSVFGPKLLMVNPRIVTFVHSTGWTCHIGELNNVTSSISTFCTVGLNELLVLDRTADIA